MVVLPTIYVAEHTQLLQTRLYVIDNVIHGYGNTIGIMIARIRPENLFLTWG